MKIGEMILTKDKPQEPNKEEQ